jgi:hypothetical protein
MLLDVEDEDSRKGNFERVYPNKKNVKEYE